MERPFLNAHALRDANLCKPDTSSSVSVIVTVAVAAGRTGITRLSAGDDPIRTGDSLHTPLFAHLQFIALQMRDVRALPRNLAAACRPSKHASGDNV